MLHAAGKVRPHHLRRRQQWQHAEDNHGAPRQDATKLPDEAHAHWNSPARPVCRILPEFTRWTVRRSSTPMRFCRWDRSVSPTLKAVIGGDRVVVAPGFLANPEVRHWLNGVELAWTMLEFGSYNALHEEPSADNPAIRLEPNLTETDLSGSAVTRTALLLLRRAADAGGLKLTQTGNLSRAVVAEMVVSEDRWGQPCRDGRTYSDADEPGRATGFPAGSLMIRLDFDSGLRDVFLCSPKSSNHRSFGSVLIRVRPRIFRASSNLIGLPLTFCRCMYLYGYLRWRLVPFSSTTCISALVFPRYSKFAAL